ncbi:hypothetical protein [Thiomonas delicata]|uniref:Uncharacterized protein n=1 Tax=Thiomonas delicata TaxID=364030 RepID=A0A238D428_THIDL|nr:hypothetical protein [Thiomonas delicata]SBP87995.1 hypothetical protein THIARS_60708 [Thiomonas delicata]
MAARPSHGQSSTALTTPRFGAQGLYRPDDSRRIITAQASIPMAYTEARFGLGSRKARRSRAGEDTADFQIAREPIGELRARARPCRSA